MFYFSRVVRIYGREILGYGCGGGRGIWNGTSGGGGMIKGGRGRKGGNKIEIQEMLVFHIILVAIRKIIIIDEC